MPETLSCCSKTANKNSSSRCRGSSRLELFAEPADGPAREVNPDALDLRVHLQRVLAHLAAVAGLLVAAEGRGRVHHVVGVYPDDARLYLAGETVGARDVARPDARR